MGQDLVGEGVGTPGVLSALYYAQQRQIMLTTKGSHSVQLERQQLGCPFPPKKNPESKNRIWPPPWKATSIYPRRALLCITLGVLAGRHFLMTGWAATHSGSIQLSRHCWPRVCTKLPSRSPQNSCPGFVGSCLGGAAALGKFLFEPQGILFRVVKLRWENTDIPCLGHLGRHLSQQWTSPLTPSFAQLLLHSRAIAREMCARLCARHQA